MLKHLGEAFSEKGVFPITYAYMRDASRQWSNGRSEWNYSTFVSRCAIIQVVFEILSGAVDETKSGGLRAARAAAMGRDKSAETEGKAKGDSDPHSIDDTPYGKTIRCALVGSHLCGDPLSINSPTYSFRWWRGLIESNNFPSAKRYGPLESVADLYLTQSKMFDEFFATNTDTAAIFYSSVYDASLVLSTVRKAIESPFRPANWQFPEVILVRIPTWIFDNLKACGLIDANFDEEVILKLERNIEDITALMKKHFGRSPKVLEWPFVPSFVGWLKHDGCIYSRWGIDDESTPARLDLIGKERESRPGLFDYELFAAELKIALGLKPDQSLFSGESVKK